MIFVISKEILSAKAVVMELQNSSYSAVILSMFFCTLITCEQPYSWNTTKFEGLEEFYLHMRRQGKSETFLLINILEWGGVPCSASLRKRT